MSVRSWFQYGGSQGVVIAKWFGTAIVALLVLLLIALALVDWNAMRGPLGRYLSAKSHRSVTLEGPLQVHLFTLTPRLSAEKIIVGNPEWEPTDAPPMLSVERIALAVKLLPLFKFDVVMPEVTIDHPEVYLHRELSGRANWQMDASAAQAKQSAEPLKLPTIQRFLVSEGKLDVTDEIRKLKFMGTVRAGESHEDAREQPFQLRGQGTLNAKPFSLEAQGGALIDLHPDEPYNFQTTVVADSTRLKASGSIRKPFDFGTLQADAQLSGKDLADMFYLTGLALPNTPPYKLSASITRNGTRIDVTKVMGSLGSSDIRGELAVDTGKERPMLTGDLRSNLLDIRDLSASLGTRISSGQPADDTAAPPPVEAKTAATVKGDANAPAKLLLPDAQLQVNRVRAMDADVRYQAGAINAGKVPMKEVSLHVLIDNGVLRLDPVAMTLPEGRVVANVRIDATHDVPITDADVRLTDVHLEQFKPQQSKGEAPLAGILQARAKLHGTGDSVHEVASNADGTVTAVVPHGEVRAAFAELTGINVARGLRMLVTKDQENAKLRCGIADFKVDDGTMKAQNLVFDTEDVLITGKGDMRLKSEQLDFSIEGQPKALRFFRLRTPIVVGGHLSKPTVGLKPGKGAAQAGAAVALGALVAPLAAVVAFVDPGLAKDANCSALFAEAKDKGTPQTKQNKNEEAQSLSQSAADDAGQQKPANTKKPG